VFRIRIWIYPDPKLITYSDPDPYWHDQWNPNPNWILSDPQHRFKTVFMYVKHVGGGLRGVSSIIFLSLHVFLYPKRKSMQVTIKNSFFFKFSIWSTSSFWVKHCFNDMKYFLSFLNKNFVRTRIYIFLLKLRIHIKNHKLP